MKLPESGDTIVAISTPPGYGGIGVVRISGTNAFDITSAIVDEQRDFHSVASHTLHHCHIREVLADKADVGNRLVDEVLVAVFKSPNSYTGEDVTEISAHGNPRILQRIIDLAVVAGCRPAAPGEFTLRAFQSGRIDLVQAESVADLIAAEGTAFQQAAMYQLSGSLSHYIGKLRKQLVEIAALFEAYTDFPDEEIPQEQRQELEDKLSKTGDGLKRLAESYRDGEILRHGIQVPIIGPPNAGKSSLFNAILAEERAIVTEIPGTTRDTISEKIDYKGMMMRIIDTAGLRDTTDQIEALGVERSRREISGSGVIVLLFDSVDVTENEVEKSLALIGERRFQLVFSKSELISQEQKDELSRLFGRHEPLFISAHELAGIDKLLNMIYSKATGDVSASPIEHTLTNRRHFDAIKLSLDSLQIVQEGLRDEQSFELLAFDLRQSIDQLEGILGRVTNEDLLAEIFSRFCIGK